MVARDNYILDMKLKIDTSDFFTYLEKIFRKFIPPSEGEWKGSGSHNGDGNWLKTYNLYLTSTITHYGYCYTFNNPNVTEFFNTDEVSENFHYNRNFFLRESWVHTSTRGFMNDSYALNYPVRTNNFRYGVHFRSLKWDIYGNISEKFYPPTHSNFIYEGNYLMIHDGYEYPSELFYTTVAPRNKSKIFYISPTMSLIDEELSEYSVNV